MKKVTKILMVVALATFSFNSFAQTFGVQAGLNMANVASKTAGEKDDSKMLLGFNVGGTAEFAINDALSFQTGLILNTKGAKSEYTYNEGGVDVKVENKANILFLDIPLNLKYKFDKIYIAAGPYLGVGVTGKMKTKASAMGFSEEETIDVKFGNDAAEDHVKRLDFGLNIGAGVDFGAIGVGVQYGFGLANLQPEGDSDNFSKNRLLSISVAYKFGK